MGTQLTKSETAIVNAAVETVLGKTTKPKTTRTPALFARGAGLIVYRKAKIPSGVEVAPGYVIMESVWPGRKSVYTVHRKGESRTAGPFASQSLGSAVKASWQFKKLRG